MAKIIGFNDMATEEERVANGGTVKQEIAFARDIVKIAQKTKENGHEVLSIMLEYYKGKSLKEYSVEKLVKIVEEEKIKKREKFSVINSNKVDSTVPKQGLEESRTKLSCM